MSTDFLARRVVAATFVVALGCAILPAAPASAAPACTITWTGGASGDWDVAMNWTGNRVPGGVGHTDDDVCVTSMGALTITVSGGDHRISSLAWSPASDQVLRLTGGSLTLSSGPHPTSTVGSVVLDGGTLTVDGALDVGGVNVTGGTNQLRVGTLGSSHGTLSGDGVVRVYGGVSVAGGDVIGSYDSTSGAADATLEVTQFANGTASVFAVAPGTTGASSRQPLLGALLAQTSRPTVISGSPTFGAARVISTTTVEIASGATVAETPGLATLSRIQGSGVITAGTGASVGPQLVINGSASSLGADLVATFLTVNGHLTIPAGRTITAHGGGTTALIDGAGTLVVDAGEFRAQQPNPDTPTVSPAVIRLAGGDVTISGDAQAAPGRLDIRRGTFTADGPTSVGAGGLSIATSPGGVGTLAGTGTVTDSGPLAITGGRVAGSSLTLVHGGSPAAFAPSLDSAGVHPWSVAGATVTTPGNLSVSGAGTLGAGASVTAAGPVSLASGTRISAAGAGVPSPVLRGTGVQTSGLAARVDPRLEITGTASVLGADLSAPGGLLLVAPARLTVPPGRKVTVPAPATLTVGHGATLSGRGTVAGTVLNDGTVAPGGGAQQLTVGSFTQSPSGSLVVTLVSPGVVDHVAVTGSKAPQIAGGISVTRPGGFDPDPGARFAVVLAPGAPAPKLTATVSDDLTSAPRLMGLVVGRTAVIARGPVPASARVTVVPSRLVLPSTRKPIATCRANLSSVRDCDVVVSAPDGTVLARGHTHLATGAAAVAVPLNLAAATAAKASVAGGVVGRVVARVTPSRGSLLVARAVLPVVVHAAHERLLGGVLFRANSSELLPAGRALLARLASRVAGSARLVCDGHTADTGQPAAEHRRGLERASVVCTFIRAQIRLLHQAPIRAYLVRSFGATRPIVAHPTTDAQRAVNRRVELTVLN